VRGGRVQELAISGMPLGMFADARHEELALDLEPGDLVALFSDGVSEPFERAPGASAPTAVGAALLEHAGHPAQEVAEAVLEAAERIVLDSHLEPDDRTLVTIRVLGD